MFGNWLSKLDPIALRHQIALILLLAPNIISDYPYPCKLFKSMMDSKRYENDKTRRRRVFLTMKISRGLKNSALNQPRPIDWNIEDSVFCF